MKVVDLENVSHHLLNELMGETLRLQERSLELTLEKLKAMGRRDKEALDKILEEYTKINERMNEIKDEIKAIGVFARSQGGNRNKISS